MNDETSLKKLQSLKVVRTEMVLADRSEVVTFRTALSTANRILDPVTLL